MRWRNGRGDRGFRLRAAAGALAALVGSGAAPSALGEDAGPLDGVTAPRAAALWAADFGGSDGPDRRAAQGAVSSSGLAALSARRAVVRIALAPGWKTYWRLPGGAGLPPRLDWSGSENAATVRTRWPRPSAFRSFGAVSIGYGGALDLAVAVTPKDPAQPVRLRLALRYAACAEICVFESAEFVATLDGSASDRAAALAVRLDAAPGAVAAAALDLSVDCAVQVMRASGRVEGPGVARLRLAPEGHVRLTAAAFEIGAVGRGSELASGDLAGDPGVGGGYRAHLADAPDAPLTAHLFGTDSDGASVQLAPVPCVVADAAADQTARE